MRMNSSKALLGIPDLPEEAFKHVGNRKIKPQGDSGGSSASPAQTQTTTAELPEWARPYAKNILAKGAALTDINQNPYQQYGGNRIAGFSPMQYQAFQGAANMDAGPQGFQEQVGQYMSPYMQNVVDVQKRGAIRDYQVGNTMQQAQATQAGAFGGGREAIQRAERERGLMGTLGSIQAQGSQAAYDQAANQFRQGIQQNLGINQLQNQYGAQMQQQAQRPLDMAYQDFLNQQNYPYKQLGFMSDLVRGLPLGQKSTSSIYDQGPGMVQTLAGLGGAAYGFGKSGLFGKEGGLMTSHAEGGQIEDEEPVIRYADGGVTSPQNVENILPKLSDQQLRQAKEAALNRRDVVEAQMIDAEMAERASIRGGLGGAFNQIPQDQQEQMMAGGGIVAFAPGGVTYKKQFESSMETLKGLSGQQPEPLTPEQYEQGVTSRQPMLERIYGQDITKPYLEETKTKRMGLADQLEKDKGLAFAMASLGMLARKRTPGESQKNQLISGLGEAGQQFAGEVGKLQRDSREADDKLRQSEILLATAQQQRKEGMANKAMSLEDKADDKRQDAFKTKAAIQEKVAQLQSGLASTEMQGENALKVAGIHAAVQREAMNKPGEIERMMSEVDAIRTGKKSFQGKTGEEGAKAYQDTLGQVGAARYGAKYTGPDTSFANDAKFQAELDKRTALLALQKQKPNITPAELESINTRIDAERQRLIEEWRQTHGSGVTSKTSGATGAPAPQQSTGTPMPQPGQVIQGYRFKGGDPSNPASWEKE